MKNSFNDKKKDLLKQEFLPLFDNGPTSVDPPKLAHYTTITALEGIMRTKQIWFSNPLFMNDIEELRFGLQEGVRLFFNNDAINEACGSKERFNKLAHTFSYFAEMREYDLDVYVLCLSEHDGNDDGLLSMWRAYGDNGSGAALVIDPKQIGNTHTSPIFLSKVKYYSPEERLELIGSKLNQFTYLLRPLKLDDNSLWLAAAIIFECITLLALITKHHGFKEEREWRLIYIKERSIMDDFWSMLHYTTTNKSKLEPKLKLKLEPIGGLNFALDNIVDRILLGPINAHHTIKSTVIRMLELVGLNDIKHKVKVSRIPYRETK